jgi:hypothetical protein
MQLSLNDWPPLTSHTACLMLGIVLANISAPAQIPLPKKLSNGLYLTVNKYHNKNSGEINSNFVNLYNSSNNCLISAKKSKTQIISGRRFVKLTEKQVAKIALLNISLSDIIFKRHYHKIKSGDKRKYCKKKPRIIYD